MTNPSVWWDGRIAGTLTRDQHGDMGFVHNPDWLADTTARPISTLSNEATKAMADTIEQRARRLLSL
jgi:HipA-like protein